MKGIYLPDTVERFILPNLKPISQLVLYKLLYYSNNSYSGNIYPGVSLLCKLCRVKEKKTIRAALKELKSWSLITYQPDFRNNRQTSNRYFLTFDTFEHADKCRGIKFKAKGKPIRETLGDIQNELVQIKHEQQKGRREFLAWCSKNHFRIGREHLDGEEIDISYMNPFSQTEIKQAANRHGLLLKFKAS